MPPPAGARREHRRLAASLSPRLFVREHLQKAFSKLIERILKQVFTGKLKRWADQVCGTVCRSSLVLAEVAKLWTPARSRRRQRRSSARDVWRAGRGGGHRGRVCAPGARVKRAGGVQGGVPGPRGRGGALPRHDSGFSQICVVLFAVVARFGRTAGAGNGRARRGAAHMV